MKPQEKIDWFWITGTVPGTMFDDWNDRRGAPSEPRRRRRSRPARHGPVTRRSKDAA